MESDRSVAIVGEYHPLTPGFNNDELGVKPQKPGFYESKRARLSPPTPWTSHRV